MTSSELQPFDYLFVGGTVIDGANTPGQRADVGVRGDRIAAIGDLSDAPARHRIDVAGQVLAPGFIDSHTHDDNYLLKRRDMTPKISQGVTTVVTGNCGISLAPLAHANPPAPLDLLDEGGSYQFARFADYLDALRATPAAVNAACMVGHSTLRAAVMPDLQREATDAEIDAMRALAEEAMASGAIGISTGAFYPPAARATTEEIIEVCRPLSTHGGIYATHMRDEGEHIVAALEETFRIGRELDVPVVISHHKVMGQPNFGRSRETLPLIEAAMARQDVSLDAYPYVAGSTMLKQDRVLLAGEDVTEAIRTEEAGMNASRVSALPAVRAALVALQHSFQRLPGLVADGRDMGTVIFPHAPLRLFLTASAECRAERRYKQLIAQGLPAKMLDLLADLKARDTRDISRSAAPLKPAPDAIAQDNSALTIEQSVSQVLALWQQRQPFTPSVAG